MQAIPVGTQTIRVGAGREYVCVLPRVETWTPAAFASEGGLLVFLPLLLSGFLMGEKRRKKWFIEEQGHGVRS